MAISMRQVKAARALLGWRQVDLAERTGLALLTIQNAETGAVDPLPGTLARIERAFAQAGLVFLQPGDRSDHGGEGIRFRRSAKSG
jgi:transcriptional regulator with XRE-family HTH domain